MNEQSKILWPIAVFLIVLLAGLAFRKILMNRLAKWAVKTKTEIDDIIIGAIKRPSLLWCAILAIYMALALSTLPQEWSDISGKILLILTVLSATLVIANIAGGMVRAYSSSLATTIPVTSLTQNVAKIIIFVIGALIVLNSQFYRYFEGERICRSIYHQTRIHKALT